MKRQTKTPMWTVIGLIAGILLILPQAAMATAEASPSQQQGAQQQAPGQMSQQQQMDTPQASMDQAQTVEKASLVLRDLMQAPEHNIPSEVLQNSAAIVIIPNLVKAGFIAGGRHGTGVMLNRQEQSWSPPIFVSISGASIGAQLGVQSSDIIMVFNDQDKVEEMLNSTDFTIGADASVAAGPAGATGKAIAENVDVFSYKRTEGLFAGVSLTGGVITVDKSATMAYYNIQPSELSGYYADEAQMAKSILNMKEGKAQDQKQIVQNVPESAQELQNLLQKYTWEREQKVESR